MAARKHKLTLCETWREHIQATMLVKRLHDHVFNGIKMSKTQVQAVQILLKKVAPDVSQVDSNVNVTQTPEANVYPVGSRPESIESNSEEATIN